MKLKGHTLQSSAKPKIPLQALVCKESGRRMYFNITIAQLMNYSTAQVAPPNPNSLITKNPTGRAALRLKLKLRCSNFVKFFEYHWKQYKSTWIGRWVHSLIPLENRFLFQTFTASFQLAEADSMPVLGTLFMRYYKFWSGKVRWDGKINKYINNTG